MPTDEVPAVETDTGAELPSVHAPPESEVTGASPVEEVSAHGAPSPPNDELARQLRRALADLDNTRKRSARELERARSAERDRVTAELIGIVDDLERALAHADGSDDAIVGGIVAVRDRAIAALSRLGYERFGQAGEPFDPAHHEAVGQTEATEQSPGTVAALVRPGYARNGSVVRPAAVLVAR